MGHFEGLLCVPLLPSKWSIFGVPEFQNPDFQTATLESGVNKDATNCSYSNVERHFGGSASTSASKIVRFYEKSL